MMTVRWGTGGDANGNNNGPMGDATELSPFPLLDQKFRTKGSRVIRAHSSGGWIVAYWLTHYPNLFARITCPVFEANS